MKTNFSVFTALGWALILTCLFVTLRMFGVIDWDLVWLISPIWICISIICLVILVYALYIAVIDTKYDVKETYVEGKLVSRKINGKETIHTDSPDES